MDKTEFSKSTPATGVWKRFLILVPLTLVMVVGTLIYIRTQAHTYTTLCMQTHRELVSSTQIHLNPVGIVEVESVEQTDSGVPRITFRTIRDGQTQATVGTGEALETFDLQVQDGVIIEHGIGFAGWQVVQLDFCVFLGALVILFGSVLVRLWRASWYGYTMVAGSGGMLFCLFQLVMFSWLWARGDTPTFFHFMLDASSMVNLFVAASGMPMTALLLAVSISNVLLIHHEGRRLVNMLGIGAGVAWVVVVLLWLTSGNLLYSLTDSIEFASYADALIAGAIAYGECLLLSVMLCAWLASRHEPKHGMDYLVVLGCGIRADGTPSPLLAGRVDRALGFDQARIAAGDAPATFVPSGGQGPDEPISEAQSMGNYLINKGVEPERIALEDRSTTTNENMAFSREIIEQHAGRNANELRVGFSTTNYHVFRGYVCAHRAGMRVEGMGSKTRAYFWPNAFLREFVGLIATAWKPVIQTYALIAIFHLLAEYVLTLHP